MLMLPIKNKKKRGKNFVNCNPKGFRPWPEKLAQGIFRIFRRRWQRQRRDVDVNSSGNDDIDVNDVDGNDDKSGYDIDVNKSGNDVGGNNDDN